MQRKPVNPDEDRKKQQSLQEGVDYREARHEHSKFLGYIFLPLMWIFMLGFAAVWIALAQAYWIHGTEGALTVFAIACVYWALMYYYQAACKDCRWEAYCDNWTHECVASYFNMRLLRDISSTNNSPDASHQNSDKRLCYGFHPHGIMGFAFSALTTNICGWKSLFPERSFPRPAAASVLMYIPIVREYFAWQGVTSANKANLVQRVREGQDICIVVGGSQEVLKSQRGVEEDRLYLKKRKGFIKLAIQEGCDLVPTYCFGATECYHQLTWFTKFQSWLVKKTQILLPIFWGQFGLPLPYSVNLTMVIGESIPVKQQDQVAPEYLDQVHKTYCQALLNLHEKYKHELGWGDKSVVID